MITEPWQFKDEQYRALFHSNVCILDESLPLLGKMCVPKHYEDCLEYKGKFIGIEATEEDFYYVFEKPEGGRHYESCCGGIEEVKNDYR